MSWWQRYKASVGATFPRWGAWLDAKIDQAIKGSVQGFAFAFILWLMDAKIEILIQ